MITFIIKSTIFLGVVYVLYMMLLAKEKIPVFKRYYLLSGLLLSVIIPFIEVNVQTSIPEAIYPFINNIYPDVEILSEHRERTNSIIWLIPAIYIIITTTLAGRYITNIFRLIQQKRKNPTLVFNDSLIVLIDQCTAPFSFLNAIYINREEYQTIRKEILIHEQAHAQQRHSIDILLVEFWRVIFWFNPLLWLYKREIKLNHEHLADNHVVKSGIDIQDYQNFMINTVFRNNSSYLVVSNYGYSFIKNRLIMLTKDKSSVRTWIKGTTPMFILALLSIAISCNMDYIADTKIIEAEWWFPLLKKHDIKITGEYYTYENIFEMGEKSSFDNDIIELTKATLLCRVDDGKSYMLIEAADTLHHNLKEGTIKTIPGNPRFYNMDSDVTKPEMEGTASALLLSYH